jgi:hypothetical protein
MAVLADDQMVVDDNFERFADGDDLMGQVNVVGGGLRISGRMIVHQNDCRCAELERAAHDFARINGCVIDGANALHLIGNKMVLLSRKSTRNSSWSRKAIAVRQ